MAERRDTESSLTGTAPLCPSGTSTAVGAQSVVASIDVKRSILGRYTACIESFRTALSVDPSTFARDAVALRVEAIIVNSIDRDGTGVGFDTELIRQVATAVSVPVVALGGASTDSDFAKALEAGASAAAAGSRFVFCGKHRAVLITHLAPSVILSFENLDKDCRSLGLPS